MGVELRNTAVSTLSLSMSLFRQGFQYIHLYIYIYTYIYMKISGSGKQQLVENMKASHCWPFLRGIYWGPMDCPRKMTVKSKCVSMLWRHHNHASMGQPHVNTLRPRQNGRHFTDDIFKRIFLNGNIWIPIKISLTFVPKGSINNDPALVQIMAWRRPMMVNLPTHSASMS